MDSTAFFMTAGIWAMGVRLRRSSPNSPSIWPSAEYTRSGSLGR
jgi:hypothetical protein